MNNEVEMGFARFNVLYDPKTGNYYTGNDAICEWEHEIFDKAKRFTSQQAVKFKSNLELYSTFYEIKKVEYKLLKSIDYKNGKKIEKLTEITMVTDF